MRIRSRACGVAAALAAAGIAWTGPAAAQEPATPSGWIGVGLQELVSCATSDRRPASCERRLMVSQLFVGGPADRAGVEPGDTLLTLEGRAIHGARDPAFAVLEPGREVRVEVGREAGRRTLTLIPGRRPADLGALGIRHYVPSVAALPRAEAVPGRPGPAVVSPSEWPGPEGWRIRIRVDDDSVRVGPLARAEWDDEGTVGVVRIEPGVWAELDLGPRLRALQDSVFLRARVRLDSIRRRWYEARARSEAERSHEHAWTPLPGPLERRLAGAEFTPLNPPLAEAFQGPDRGLLVLRVLPGTPASRVGLRPGDVVVEAGGRRCDSLEDLRRSLEDADGPGALVVKWVRKGREMNGLFRDD